MSSLIFKFFLPILLGYTLFVGLSGRFNPFSKPSELTQRPSWLLGSWIGLSVAIVTGVVLHMAYQLPLDAVKTLIKPTGLLMAALVVPGLIAYLVYSFYVRSHIKNQERLEMNADEIMEAQIDEIDFDDTLAMETDGNIADTTLFSEHHSETTNAVSDTPINFNEVVDSGDDGSVSLLFDGVTTPTADDDLHDANNAEVLQSTGTPAIENKTSDESVELTNELDVYAAETTSESETTLETEIAEVTGTTEVVTAVEVEKLKAEIDELKGFLDTESSLRSHTETHLRITRKALKNLEGDTRDFESDKADALINVEGQLDSRIKEVAAAQALASREEAARIEAETTIVNIKQDMLEAKRELRRNTEARAKALGTANKTVAFARQSVQARTRAEARIKQLENRLKLSQETVSSLISALDKEKARTQADVTEMAKELILQQKRINEKRTLDEASRRTPKRLTRRTAKKVS